MRDAAAESLEMDAPFNNNLPTPFSDVMDNPQNPVNPDSNQGRQHVQFPLTSECLGVRCIVEGVRYEKCKIV
jgi:hypothetical protein